MAPELMTDEEVGTCDISMVGVYVFGILIMWAVLITRTEPHDKVCKEQRAEAQYMATCKPRVPFCPPPAAAAAADTAGTSTCACLRAKSGGVSH
jgi:hypothetical protein